MMGTLEFVTNVLASCLEKMSSFVFKNVPALRILQALVVPINVVGRHGINLVIVFVSEVFVSA